MFSHDKIWLAIERLAETNGYSASGLARRAGLDPTTFNKSKRTSPDGKLRWPSTESVSRILGATGTELPAFVALMEDDAGPAASASPSLPSLRLDRSARGGCFDAHGYPSGTEWAPEDLFRRDDTGGRAVHMVEISGRAFEPIYRDGDRLILSPAAPLRRGDRAAAGMQDGTIVIGEVVRRTATRLALLLPSGETEIFSAPDLLWTARILWTGR